MKTKIPVNAFCLPSPCREQNLAKKYHPESQKENEKNYFFRNHSPLLLEFPGRNNIL